MDISKLTPDELERFIHLGEDGGSYKKQYRFSLWMATLIWEAGQDLLEKPPIKPYSEEGIHKLRMWCADSIKKLSASTDSGAGDSEAGGKETNKKLPAESKAIVILMAHTDWSDTKIAKETGIARTTLYTFPLFKKARELIKAKGKKALMRGSKDGETGTIEAWD